MSFLLNNNFSMASIKKIRQFNNQQFLDDAKAVSEFGVIAGETWEYFPVSKRWVMAAAEKKTIQYYISDKIYKVRRSAMIIL